MIEVCQCLLGRNLGHFDEDEAPGNYPFPRIGGFTDVAISPDPS